jgi:prepilin-type N-terminal cleavage/methylation domain-containing protein
MSPHRAPSVATATRPSAGFTLIELVVVMGILSGFLVMLVQLVDAGLRIFAEGENGQVMADRANRVQRLLATEFAALRGSSTGRDRDVADDRLLVQWLPLGLPPRPEENPNRAQVVRAAVHLPPDREAELRDAALMLRVLRSEGQLSPVDLERRIAELRATEPLRGIGNLLLLPWRQEGDEALLELRVGWFVPGQEVPLDRDRFVDPFAVVVPGTPDLPALVVHENTTALVNDLLHVEFAFWSQRTRGWDLNTGSASAPGQIASGGPGPERIWDSARGGWLVDLVSGGEFAFDRGPTSLADTSDDIHPHAILVRCVVAQPSDLAAEGLLAVALSADDQAATLVNGDRFPGARDGGWIKIRHEWLRYEALDGHRLRGLQRGMRGTRPAEHGAGVRLHVGRSVDFVVPVPHAKDDWNG